MFQRMTPKDYSEFWERESSQFQKEKIYERLSKIAPAEPTLEVGCGSGWSTLSLVQDRSVLPIDSNPYLIDIAKDRLQSHGVNVDIIQSDLFEPSEEMLQAINKFEPRVIVGWFIGSHPGDNDKRTPTHLRIEQKPKVYRENVEDRLVALPLCPPSVEWVHTVQRGGLPPGVTENQVRDGVIKEYNEFMFKNSGFSVIDVQVMDWVQGDNPFPYVENHNPNLPQGRTKPIIVSILARRHKK